MNFPTSLLLGAIAGGTILIGLPIGRLRSPAPRLRIVLNAVAVGVLLFLFWDVCAAAWEPVDARLSGLREGNNGLAPVLGYGLLFGGGLVVGLLSLVGYDRYRSRAGSATTETTTPPLRVEVGTQGPGPRGGVALAEPAMSVATWSSAKHMALLIAVGIGLHNFAEGLAIGQSAASGEIALATVLVVGFALHNATEGFGIVAPLAAEAAAGERPSWRFLLTMAAIGGGPTFLGTALGHSTSSEPLSVVFLTLAAGSIVYVIAQLLGVAAKARRGDLVAYGLLIGILAGFITDAVVTVGGA